MDTIFEIFKTIFPAIITGIFTFLATKYTYNKNIPLDKMEIAYDKIYNPIYHILLQNNSNNICTNQISLDIFVILNKYNDYADRSTLHAFDLYHKNRDKDSFINFKNNINNKYIYLRKRLGYLEPNLIQAYTYSSKNEKSVLRLVLECTVAYITMLAYALLSASVHTVITWIAFSLICIIIIELLTLFFRNILIYIREIIKHIKSNNKCRKN